jgi:hypothetical protein
MAWSQLTRDIEVAVHWEDHSLHWFTHFTPATEKLGVRRQQMLMIFEQWIYLDITNDARERLDKQRIAPA